MGFYPRRSPPECCRIPKKGRNKVIDDEDANNDGGTAQAPAEDVNEELYEPYMPKKVKEGVPHPDIIVETASLAAIDPPDPTYKHHLQVCNQFQCISALLHAQRRLQRAGACMLI